MEWQVGLGSVNEEMELLQARMNPPGVSIDNISCPRTTIIKVNSANEYGSLLRVVQVLNDLNITIYKAYIASDKGWFMDVFYVVDLDGNKLIDNQAIEGIVKSLGQQRKMRKPRKPVVEPAAEHTTVELTGRDRPGLLSEIFGVLLDLNCNILSAEVWTHNARMASILYITDAEFRFPIEDPGRLSMIKKRLKYILRGDAAQGIANTFVLVGVTHTERRLHQLMYGDRDYDEDSVGFELKGDRSKPTVIIENFEDKLYSAVQVICPDRPKLVYDTVCTLHDLEFMISHGSIKAEGPEAHLEFFIRHLDGTPIGSEAEKQRVMHCLEAAIRRRTKEGIRFEFRGEDCVGLVSEVTRIFRENGLNVSQAEIRTRGPQAEDVFYVVDCSGSPIKTETIETVRKMVDEAVAGELKVKDESPSPSPPESSRFSLSNLIRTRSEKFLSQLGLVKSYS